MDEQVRRVKERMENPAKQWKITDEDWRNREGLIHNFGLDNE